jgi:predicted nucleic acid-binding protein
MDVNVFCRPFDDKTQSRIAQEASAFVTILAEVVAGNVTCIGSDILDIEVKNTPDEVKRLRLLNLTGYCSEKVIMDEAIRKLGNELENRARLKPRDALHIASAARGLADYFLTCDDKIVKRAKDIQGFLAARGVKLQILNPMDFLKELM